MAFQTTIKRRSKSEFDKAVFEAMAAGWKLKSQGYHGEESTFKRLSFYWAKLEKV